MTPYKHWSCLQELPSTQEMHEDIDSADTLQVAANQSRFVDHVVCLRNSVEHSRIELPSIPCARVHLRWWEGRFVGKEMRWADSGI